MKYLAECEALSAEEGFDCGEPPSLRTPETLFNGMDSNGLVVVGRETLRDAASSSAPTDSCIANTRSLRDEWSCENVHQPYVLYTFCRRTCEALQKAIDVLQKAIDDDSTAT